MGGLKDVRVACFRANVTLYQLQQAAALFAAHPRPTLIDIVKLKLPQFSGVSFVSKIRMFLDPTQSATLDKQIMKIHDICATTVLARVTDSGTQIRVSGKNSNAYEAWCDRLAFIARTYLPNLRVVDIERGLFHLIQTRQVHTAAAILNDA